MELQVMWNIDKIKSMVIEWEVEASQIKMFMNKAEKQFKELKEFIDERTKQEVYEWKTDKFELRLRSTYDYSSDEEWQEIKNKLKQREEILKTATEMSLKNSTYVDEDWVIIEPVNKITSESLYIKK